MVCNHQNAIDLIAEDDHCCSVRVYLDTDRAYCWCPDCGAIKLETGWKIV
jgi:Zn finger protein HypA/HybF involved in hydrogenase expression